MVYYNYYKIKFKKFKYIRERADKIDWYVSLALNKQRKRFKGSLIPLFKGLVMSAFVTVAYKGFNISTKLRLELVTRETLI
jgi:hypothetical protein